MLSFIFHGVRWKINAPRQLRLFRNLQRLDTRIARVNAKLHKLEAKGYIKIRPICSVQDGLSVRGPNPFLFMPSWDCPIGGVDKDGRPDNAPPLPKGDMSPVRMVGDMGVPHSPLYVRNKPHGNPDGDLVVSFNDLSGPKGKVKESYVGPTPFNYPEVKPRPRHKMASAAHLRYYAFVNNTFCVTVGADMVDCFCQHMVADEELHLCVYYTVMLINYVKMLVAIEAGTMNQGGRSSSKLASDFAEEWQESWCVCMDKFVVDWLPKQTPALQSAYASRREKLGHIQARPFTGYVYTDNYDKTFCSSDLAAAGLRLWRQMNKDAGIVMQDKVLYGTCTDWIGGRFVLSGGFTCLSPSKRRKAINACELALAGRITRESYDSNNAFLAHVAEICDWPKSSFVLLLSRD